MNEIERAKLIVEFVLRMDKRWGKPSAPREGSDKPSRIITDDPRWYAQLTREDHKGADGELWDWIEVYAYQKRRMAAAFRGDGIRVPVYISGTWESLFCLFDLPQLEPVQPNKGTKYEM